MSMDKELQNILKKLAELIFDWHLKNIALKRIQNSAVKAK